MALLALPSLPPLRFALCLLMCAGSAGSLLAQNGSAWPAAVEAAWGTSKLPREALSVVVVPVGSSKVRWSYRADESVNPASVMKLVTTAAALDLLGPSWTWQTQVFLKPHAASSLHKSRVAGGVFHGDVVLKGHGDPKWVSERLWLLMRRLRGLGIREIDGDIVLDNSAFAVDNSHPADFDGEPLRPYNALPEALLLNYRSVLLTFTPDEAAGLAHVHAEPPMAGLSLPASVPLSKSPCNDWRALLKADFSQPGAWSIKGPYPLSCGEKSWPVAAPDAALFDGQVIKGLWQQVGGKLKGQVHQGLAAADLKPLLEISSPPLSEVVRDINKFSNNVMAQQLFLSLSHHLNPQSLRPPSPGEALPTGSTAQSRELLLRWWQTRLHGVSPPRLDNGSGLSREQRISVNSLMQLLQWSWRSALMPELMASLPISGVDGTLSRMKERNSTNAALGVAHLKTGSLRDAVALAGYVLGASGQRYVMVAVVNHAQAQNARPALDALVEWVALLLGFVGGAAVGAALVWLWLRQQRAQAEALLHQQYQGEVARLGERVRRLDELDAELTQERAALRLSREALVQAQAQLLAEQQQGQEKLRLLQEAREQLSLQFKTLAHDILEEKSKRFAEQNQLSLGQLLGPLRTQINEFKTKVEDIHHKDIEQQAQLKAELTQLKDLNRQVTEEAHSLATALKGQSKVQGNWGELILENVLDRSGLREGTDFQREKSFTTESGRSRPDVVVFLPQGKHLVVDAKVSLNAYTRFVNAQSEVDRSLALREHVAAVASRIKELSDRSYFSLPGLNSPEMVFMFIPIESAFVEALKADESLFQKAIEQNVLVATPTTLLTSLNIVRQLWRFEAQNAHSAELAERAAKVYKKLSTFLESMGSVGRQLDSAKDSFAKAMGQLVEGKDNLIKQANEFQKLGVSVQASLPEALVARAELELDSVADEAIPSPDDAAAVKQPPHG